MQRAGRARRTSIAPLTAPRQSDGATPPDTFQAPPAGRIGPAEARHSATVEASCESGGRQSRKLSARPRSARTPAHSADRQFGSLHRRDISDAYHVRRARAARPSGRRAGSIDVVDKPPPASGVEHRAPTPGIEPDRPLRYGALHGPALAGPGAPRYVFKGSTGPLCPSGITNSRPSASATASRSAESAISTARPSPKSASA